jgi:hypothetical protein
MLMGNFFRRDAVAVRMTETTHPGIRHPTVVPANAEREDEGTDGEDG